MVLVAKSAIRKSRLASTALYAGLGFFFAGCVWLLSGQTNLSPHKMNILNSTPVMTNKHIKPDAEWKKELTPEQYHVLREKGTERAFTGKYWDNHAPGIYKCAGCGAVLFVSGDKFDSGCGWPSFDQPASSNVVSEAADNSHFMHRTEVLCSKCGGHLGHVFNDGPRDTTGLRYCINSASLEFEPKENASAKK